MRCELALLQESISHVQQEQHNLQSHLAKQEQSLTQKQTEFSETETQLVQLRCDKQQDEQHAQVQEKWTADATADHHHEAVHSSGCDFAHRRS